MTRPDKQMFARLVFCLGSYCGGTPGAVRAKYSAMRIWSYSWRLDTQQEAMVRIHLGAFANPLRGGVMEVEMRILFLCLFFLGCKSQPALYEMIEVKHGETMLDMHRRFRSGEEGQMPEVPAINRPANRQDHNLAKACRDNPAKGKAVLGAGQLFHAVFR